MTTAELTVEVVRHEEEIGSLKHRMQDCEQKNATISELVQSINKLAINMDYMAQEQKKQGQRLARLEEEPIKSIKQARTTIITAVITAVVGLAVGALWTFIFK